MTTSSRSELPTPGVAEATVSGVHRATWATTSTTSATSIARDPAVASHDAVGRQVGEDEAPMLLDALRTRSDGPDRQPRRLRAVLEHDGEARPAIRRERSARDEREWVAVDVAAGDAQLRVVDDRRGVEPPREQRAVTPCPAVVRHCVLGREVLHGGGEFAAGVVPDEVKVVRHEHVRMEFDGEPFGDVAEQRLEQEPVLVTAEDVLAVRAAIVHVEPVAGAEVSSLSSHAPIMRRGCDPVRSGTGPERTGCRSAGFGVGDGLLAHPLAEGVLQLGLLDEEVVLGGEPRPAACGDLK